MQLQPSTQSWRVIWVRGGMARSSAMESDNLRSTRPPTSMRQSAKSFAAWAAYSSVWGLSVPLARKTGAMSFLENSGASAWCPANRRCIRRVRFSTSPSALTTHCCSESGVQAASISAPALASIPLRRLRRVSAIGPFPLDHIASRDHRTHIVPRAREHDHDHVDDEEAQEPERAKEMDRARGLAPEEHPGKDRERRVHRRRYGQARQHHQR